MDGCGIGGHEDEGLVEGDGMGPSKMKGDGLWASLPLLAETKGWDLLW